MCPLRSSANEMTTPFSSSLLASFLISPAVEDGSCGHAEEASLHVISLIDRSITRNGERGAVPSVPPLVGSRSRLLRAGMRQQICPGIGHAFPPVRLLLPPKSS
ncbi:unnamed protein product [Soboliphyme baturini]|uniref:Secreted protein n=1 Tax=Soboliphyme baturini TaxID=241478 RepID=A0A183IY66_9BILA|nr:unnamed protein product [Soboliphyme baturini]